MDSLYEPAPEHQEAKDTTAPESQATTPVGTHADCGPPDRSMSLVSNINCKTCNTFWKKNPQLLCMWARVYSAGLFSSLNSLGSAEPLFKSHLWSQ